MTRVGSQSHKKKKILTSFFLLYFITFSVATDLFQGNVIYGPTMYFRHPIYYFNEDRFHFITIDRV